MNTVKNLAIAVTFLFAASSAMAESSFPEKDWTNQFVSSTHKTRSEVKATAGQPVEKAFLYTGA
jgi:opacity protein-like surface antigen